MATITITLEAPDAAVPLIRRTLGEKLGEPAPKTAAEMKSSLERYLKRYLKSDVSQRKQHEAQIAAIDDDSDGSASW